MIECFCLIYCLNLFGKIPCEPPVTGGIHPVLEQLKSWILPTDKEIDTKFTKS